MGNVQEFKSSRKLKLLGMALRVGSTNPWKVSSKNVIMGKNCDIHPRAYLENAVLGDNVEVGAGAVIRGAEIGDNVVIPNNTNIFMSVLGNDCAMRDGCCMQFTLAFPGAVQVNRFVNCATMGRNSFVADGVTLTDFRFDGENMKVMHKGSLVDTGGVFLGPCIGHDSYLGSGVIVGPGREIPNDVKVVMNRDRVIMGGDFNRDFRIIKKERGS
jgi:NDP-sugar pyrophosphorylase family protein